MSGNSNISVECVVGDIAQQTDVDAVVNAANAQLRTGGGVTGALHRVAGPGLAEEGRPLAPIKPGQAVVTSGYNLPNRWVIHCLGPVYGVDKPEDQLLAACYRNALTLADQHGIERLAFPALSTGAFGYPAEEAAQVCAATLEAILPTLNKVRLVRFVLFNEATQLILYQALAQRLTIGPAS